MIQMCYRQFKPQQYFNYFLSTKIDLLETSTCGNTKCTEKHHICLRDLLSNKPQCQICSYKCSRLHQSGIVS